MTPVLPRQWYLAKNKQRLGPFVAEQLRQMLAIGMLQPTDMLLEEGQQKWRQVREIDGVFPVAVPVVVPSAPIDDAPDTRHSGGREARAESPRRWLTRLAVVGVPCLLLSCLLPGVLVYFFSSGERAGPTTSERLKVIDKRVQYPRGREGNRYFARYSVTVEDEKGCQRTLFVNDSFMPLILARLPQPVELAGYSWSEALFDNIELFKTYQVFFKGDTHHFTGLTPKCRSHDPKEMTKLIQRSAEAESQVFELLVEGDSRAMDEIRMIREEMRKKLSDVNKDNP